MEGLLKQKQKTSHILRRKGGIKNCRALALQVLYALILCSTARNQLQNQFGRKRFLETKRCSK
jgi:hypothetical protein